MAGMSTHQKFPESFLVYVAKGPTPRILFLSVLIFSTYCVYSAYLAVTSTSICVDKGLREARLLGNMDSLRPFENDVLLEYQSFKDLCNKTNWTDKDCHDALPKASWKSNTNQLSQLPSYNFTQISPDLLSCEDINKLWNNKEYKAFKEIPKTNENLIDKILVKKGVLSNFLHFKNQRLLTQEAFYNTPGYDKLKEQVKKRFHLGWNMEGLPFLFGACVSSTSVRFVLEDIAGTTICDPQNPKETNFTLSSCHQLAKFQNFVKKEDDVNVASLKFTRNFMCLIGLLEKKNLLVEDFHGSQFTTTATEMKIIVNDLDNLFYYGKRNVYGNNICIKDVYCPSPRGSSWQNGSANTAIYKGCHDIIPTCSQNRCVGFNASLHLCGVARWLRPILATFEHVKVQRTLANFFTTLTTPYAEVRKTGEMACDEVSDMLRQYENEKRNGAGSPRKRFHVGRRHPNPLPNR